MLRARLLTAAVALPLLFWLVCYAPAGFFPIALWLCTVLALYEYFSLIQARLSFSPFWGIAWGMAIAGSVLLYPLSVVSAVIVFGLFVSFVFSLTDPQSSQGLSSVSDTLLGVIYIGFLVPHIALLHRGPDGTEWVLFVFLVAMLGDTAGYGIGRMWGKHKLIPHVSPGKTIEGSFGSVLGNLTGACISWGWFFPQRSLVEFLLLGLFSGILAQIGDLCESAIKRAYGVKDSGHFLPGHGGILDRLDSLLFPAAFIYYYEKIWS